MDPVIGTYTVAYKASVTRKLNGDCMKAFWKDWLTYGVKCGLYYMLYGLIAWVFIS
ncbi:MAG: hypothetical protein H7Y17_14120, partial [Chlorobia bacterium]|nr:hypothetical protein [Fimbriimonadaceae bacterium]